MLMAVLLVAAVALGWVLAYGTTSSERREPAAKQDRRLRWVERHPGEVNTGDVERALLAQGLCLADVRLVAEKAFELRIRPFTMWMWIKQYGARELAVAVAAETSHDTLLEHLSEGTLPDFAELEVFAGLNGLVAAAERSGKGASEAAMPQVREPEPEPVPRRRSLADLDIHEPGEWPKLPAQPKLPVTEPRRLPPGWDSFFDDLAA
jgi:hypothetical protein